MMMMMMMMMMNDDDDDNDDDAYLDGMMTKNQNIKKLGALP